MAVRKPGAWRRREIADAALKVIAQQGLGRFTALSIAREVGVSDAALFRHFASKEAIVLAAIERLEEVLSAGFPAPGGDPLGRLGAFFRQRVALLHEHPGLGRLVASEELALAAPPQGVERAASLRRRSHEFVRSSLEEARRDGLLAPGVGVREAEVVVLGCLQVLNHGPFALAPRAEATALAESVWLLLERLLRSGEERRRRDGAPAPRAGRARRPA